MVEIELKTKPKKNPSSKPEPVKNDFDEFWKEATRLPDSYKSF